MQHNPVTADRGSASAPKGNGNAQKMAQGFTSPSELARPGAAGAKASGPSGGKQPLEAGATKSANAGFSPPSAGATRPGVGARPGAQGPVKAQPKDNYAAQKVGAGSTFPAGKRVAGQPPIGDKAMSLADMADAMHPVKPTRPGVI